MKYMNHLRKLALLSSLALSFSVAVHADGTLPLPVQDTTGKLEMADDNSGITLTLRNQSLKAALAPKYTPPAGLPVESCDSKDVYYSTPGSVQYNGAQYYVHGVCKSSKSPSIRTVVVTEVPDVQKSSYFMLLTGKLSGQVDSSGILVSTESMSGEMQIKPFVTASPTVAEAETLTAVPFNLYRKF